MEQFDMEYNYIVRPEWILYLFPEGEGQREINKSRESSRRISDLG